MRVEFVNASEEHVAPIAAHARAEDVAEVWASNRYTMEQALRAGIKVSSKAYTALIDGEPVAMLGVSPYSAINGIGIAWMLGTAALDSAKGRRAIVRLGPEVLGHLRSLYPTMLFNYVDARNRRALRFLRRYGFTVMAPTPAGSGGAPFHPIYIQGASNADS